MKKLRVGVLASGRGSNLQAILDRARAGEIDVEVAVVLSDVENAPALERAREAGVPALYIAPGRFRTKLEPAAERAYAEAIERHRVDVVALAGFMRILHDDFLTRFAGRVVNIHPSLLPAFPGLEAQRKALECGVKWTGATVHFVDAGVDSGPIIVQEVVPVIPGDTTESLSARVLEREHEIYPRALQYLAEGRIRVEGRTVTILPRRGEPGERTTT